MTHDDHTLPPPDGEPQPTAYALHGTLTLAEPWSETEVRKGVDAFFAELTRSLRELGCLLIGHIKGLLAVEGSGHLFFSLTSFGEKARYKGELTGKIAKARLTINVIVYGVEQRIVERAVQEGFRRHFLKGAQE